MCRRAGRSKAPTPTDEAFIAFANPSGIDRVVQTVIVNLSRLAYILALGVALFGADAVAQQRASPSSRDPLDPSYFPHAASAVSTVRADPANTSVWITGPLEKVLQTNTTPGSTQSLQISAARNEFADFQVHALPTANSIQMNVKVGDFTNSQAGYVIPSATNVFLYREAYLNITTLSDQNGTLGVTPDPLIPTVDPYFGQTRNAFPVTVQANQTQSAWIDVLVPATAPSGYYSATITISDGSNVIGQLSVVLKVWAFTLPSTATLKSAFGVSNDPNGMCIQAYGAGSDYGYSECAQYPGSGGNSDTSIELIHRSEAIFALDHRVSISQVVYVGPPAFGDSWPHFVATYGDLLNGTASTLLSGAALTTIQYAPPAADQLVASVIQEWVTNFTANNWLGQLFDYTCDEPPNGCTWSTALSNEQAIYSASPDLRTLITTNIANGTQNNVLPDLNIIVPVVNDMEPQGGSNQRSTYDSFLSGANKYLWWYQSCESHGSCSNGTVGPSNSTWPSYMIDATPVRNRIFQWLAFIDSIKAELYYTTDWCWTANAITANTCASSDPWVSVYSFGGNGDGTLFYPGTPAKIGGTTPVPVPSIRFKLIRDGMQDYEYLIALSNAGQDAFARSTAASFITNAYTFNNDPQALLAAREALGDLLQQLALPPPTVTAIDPTRGPTAGGTSVTITGTNFTGATAVQFGSANATSFTISSGTSISAISPANALGTVDVTVTGPGGTSVTSAADQFNYTVTAHDFNGDGKSDIAWRGPTGDLAIWLMNGTQILSGPDLGNVPTSWSIVGQRPLNNSGFADLLWRSSTGDLSIWFMNGTQILSTADFGTIPTNWSIVGTSAYSASKGYAELFWRDTAGDLAIWQINGRQILAGPNIGNVPTSWTIAGIGNFSGTGATDLLWRGPTGDVAIWFMNGTQIVSSPDFINVPLSWTIVGTGDFNGDGKTDILWRSSTGDVSIWLMNGTQILSGPDLGNVPTNWTIAETGDFDGDGKSDILWRGPNGDVAIWFMNGTQILSGPDFINVPTTGRSKASTPTDEVVQQDLGSISRAYCKRFWILRRVENATARNRRP